MGSFLENLGPAKYYIIGMAVFCAVWIVVAMIWMQRKKGNNSAWLREHPNASKVYIKSQQGVIKQGSLMISAVDDEKPRTFIEGTKTGFYVLPGPHVVESTYQTVRPGFFYRTVTETYGPTKQEIEVKEGREYEYLFDLKEKSYSFVEK